jgi:hypothetical protein
MNSMKRQKNRTLKHKLPRSAGTTGYQWRANSRKNEEMEPMQKQHPVVDVTGVGSFHFLLLLFDLRSNAVEVMKIMGPLSKGPMQALLHSVPPSLHQATAEPCICQRLSWTLKSKSGSISFGVTAPFSWVLVHTHFCLCPPRVCFPSLV